MIPISEMISASPNSAVMPIDRLAECIEACIACAQVNLACADACLGEPDPHTLTRCVRLNLDCADICTVTGRVVSRQHKPELYLLRKQLESCVFACQICASECELHQREHEHCRMCAEQCRRTERSCQQMLDVIAQGEGAVHRRAAQRPS